MTPDVPPDPVRVAVAFTSLIERLGIAYVVGGSFASSVHGEPRSTNDVDVVADLTASHIPLLQSALNSTYYMSPEAAQEAVSTGGAFNVIDLDTMVKVDVFVAGSSAFNAERLAHRVRVSGTTRRASCSSTPPSTWCFASWSGTVAEARFPSGSGATCWASSGSRAIASIAAG